MLRSDEALAKFIEGEETKKPTTKGAAVALSDAVQAYQAACGGLGRKTKDNSEWKSVVAKYFGLKRLSQNKWEAVCAEALTENLLEVITKDSGRSYWSLPSLKEEPLKEEPTEGSPKVPEQDQSIPNGIAAMEYDPEEEQEPTWKGFSEKELEIIELLNVAFLRGRAILRTKATVYNAHIQSLIRNEPLKVSLRIRPSAVDGQAFGYCCNADGRYTGGLCNCAYISARNGIGIMPSEDRKKVKEARIKPCPNCPHKTKNQ